MSHALAGRFSSILPPEKSFKSLKCQAEAPGFCPPGDEELLKIFEQESEFSAGLSMCSRLKICVSPKLMCWNIGGRTSGRGLDYEQRALRMALVSV